MVGFTPGKPEMPALPPFRDIRRVTCTLSGSTLSRRQTVAEVLVRYATHVVGQGGTRYVPQACGGIASDGLWEGWIEFLSGDDDIRTGRETEQPTRDALMYWAQGLTDTYLDGALLRATRRLLTVSREPLTAAPRFDGPAPPPPKGFRPRHAILDPFATFDQGEDLLRRQLSALSHDNLVAIVSDYALPVHGTGDMPSSRLVDAIAGAVRTRRATTHPRGPEGGRPAGEKRA